MVSSLTGGSGERASSLAAARFAGRRAALDGRSFLDRLRGRTAPWGWPAGRARPLPTGFALLLRLRGLPAEGFGDDEVHKWLAANRYLERDFSGDDVEHPMLDEVAHRGARIAGRVRFGWAPETMTRLPNALAGASRCSWSRCSRAASSGAPRGLAAAPARPVSATLRRLPAGGQGGHAARPVPHAPALVHGGGEGRRGRRAAPRARCWELGGARRRWPGMLASKYFFFLTPIPVVFYLWVRGTGRPGACRRGAGCS